MTKNIGIAFVTGRRHFQNVLRTYVNNWHEHGLIEDSSIRLHLFIVYDVNYFHTEPGDFRNIPSELSGLFESVNFYGRKALKEEGEGLVADGTVSRGEADLLFGEGYAKKRNAALYFASKAGMDRLLFIDDDEYPMAVYRDDADRLTWEGQSILGTHLKYIENADITHGYHCGYVSPIPKIDFDKTLTESDFRNFVEATSNDIITWRSFKETVIKNNGLTYATRSITSKKIVFEVPEVMGMKFISGANLCFNLERMDTLPVFYNPPGARGEDAFMSTTLSQHKVIKVPCFTFHDGFLRYKHLLTGILPNELRPVDAHSPQVRQRFIRASIGWIRYKPLLTYITRRDEYDSIIRDMTSRLDSVIPRLCKYFETDEFEQVRDELQRYHRNVERHHRNFEATRVAWSKVTANLHRPIQNRSFAGALSVQPADRRLFRMPG